MGTDISWIVERHHEDGAWEAVLSEQWIVHVLGRNFSGFLSEDVRAEVADRSYTRYGLLSGVRGEAHPELGLLVHEGLPQGASAMTRETIAARELHDPGWFRLSEIETAISRLRDTDGTHAITTTLMEMFQRGVRALLANEGPYDLPPDRILHGRLSDQEDAGFPDMEGASNHVRLAMAERARGLLPIADDTARVVIGYDC